MLLVNVIVAEQGLLDDIKLQDNFNRIKQYSKQYGVRIEH